MEQREIKFRVWDKINNRMNPHTRGFISQHGEFMVDLDPTGINMQGTMKIGYRKQQYEFAGQFTGLKDKNGKEIYEGDILTSHMHLTHFKKPNYDPVVFNDGAFCWQGKPLGWDEEAMEPTDSDWAIVSGNIFENPELLNFKN